MGNIHNIFNKDLLTRCRRPQFKGQHMEMALLPEIINKEEEYEYRITENKKYTILSPLKVL